MAHATNNTALALEFYKKFGLGERHLPIDQFDCWIIDMGLATDPDTGDTKDQRYKGFVQERARVRNLLNSAGSMLNGDSFQIVVNGRGEPYSITSWASEARVLTREISQQIRTYTDSRVKSIKALRNKAELLIVRHGSNEDLELAQQLTSAMVTHGIAMQAKIGGLLQQYELAYNAVMLRLSEAAAQEQESET